MKRKSKKEIKKADRSEWIEAIEFEIDEIRNEIDNAFEGITYDENCKKMVDAAINDLQERLKRAINAFEISGQMVLDEKDCLENALDELYMNHRPPTDAELNRIVDISTDSSITGKHGYWIPSTSMSEDIKIEALIDELQNNPYQLKLIA